MLKQCECGGLRLGLALAMSALATSMALAAPLNLAPSGTANSSAILGGFPASLANNSSRVGNNADIFHSAVDASVGKFWEVNLGSMQYLDRIQLFPRTSAAQSSVENFNITVYNSANTPIFTKNYFATGSTNDIAWGTTDVRGLQGQTVRITRLDASPDFITFGEFEVWGQSTPVGQNLLKGLSAANFDTRNAANVSIGAGAGTQNIDAADGYIDSHYGHTDTQNGGPTIGSASPIFHTSEAGPATGGYWQVDLGQLTDIDYVNIFRRGDFTSNANLLTLQVLATDNGVPVFSQALSMGVNDNGAPRYDFTVDLTGVHGRFLRIVDNDSGANAALALAEVEVFGAALPEPSSIALWSMLGALGLVVGWRATSRRNR